MSVHHPFPRLLGSLLSATAARVPDKEALVFGDERVTWAQFDRRVGCLAKAFLEMGIQRGDRIGVISTTRPEYLYTYLAAARVGAILVGFNILYTPPELARLVGLTRPAIMVVLGQVGGKKVAESLKALVDSLPFVKHLVVVGEGAPAGTVAFADLIATDRPAQNAALAARASELDQDDGVLIVFTSGSTGLPKGAVLTHRNIIDNIAVETRQFGFREDDRALLHLPLSHVGGATELTVPALMTGGTLVMMDHFHPLHTLQAIAQERITVLGQVPTMYIMELNLPNFADFDLSSLRTVLVAGAATPRHIMQKMMKMAPLTITGYGMTEVGGFVTYTKPEDDPETIALTVGAVAPEFELRVVGQGREELPLGATGEVAIRGSCVMKGYFDDPAETAAAIDAEGWFHTGDVGRLDSRGYLTLVDRKKDMFITGGYNVYPREIEEHISRHAKVAVVACMGTKDAILGEVGTAHVVPRPGVALTSEEISAHCREGLAEYKIPKYVEIREKLPLTSLGKVDKMQLRREMAGG
jgi:fatty-acyl-CoA synthase